MGKTLRAIVLASAVGLAACGPDHPEYNFDGKIGEDRVRYYEAVFVNEGTLEVTKPGKTKILFVDKGHDLKLDYVEITVGSNTTRYNANSKNPEAISIFQEGQRQFDEYLKRITEIQTASFKK